MNGHRNFCSILDQDPASELQAIMKLTLQNVRQARHLFIHFWADFIETPSTETRFMFI